MNRFAYAEANPATFTDPSGHTSCGPDGIYCSTATSAALNCTASSGCASATTHTADELLAAAKAYHRRQDDAAERESHKIKAIAATESTPAPVTQVVCGGRAGCTWVTVTPSTPDNGTLAGIGDAFGDLWNGVVGMGGCTASLMGGSALQDCVGIALGLATTVLDPGAIAAQRADAISSGDTRAGAHAITSTLIDVLGLAALPIGAEAALPVEGVEADLDAAAQVSAAADSVAARPIALTPRQAAAVRSNPNLLKAFLGYNLH